MWGGGGGGLACVRVRGGGGGGGGEVADVANRQGPLLPGQSEGQPRGSALGMHGEGGMGRGAWGGGLEVDRARRGGVHVPGPGCNRREGASEAVGWAVGGGCQSGWGRLLSVTNASEPGTWRRTAPPPIASLPTAYP